jgi:hypothetical protein
MRLIRLGLATTALAVLAGVATVAQVSGTAGIAMASAAQKFLDSLTPEQKAKAQMPFDARDRLEWYFVPRQDRDKKPTRKGLRVEEMTAPQREAALALLRAGTSPGGYDKAVTIMSLESILNELEKGGATVRNPGWYFVSIYGTPGATGQWSWRVEGHHLSINYLVEDGKVKSATPAFFGANPATVMAGSRKGLRAIPDCDDLARELFLSLDDGQRQLAKQEKQFPEIDNHEAAKVGTPVGVPAARLNGQQRATLSKLIHAYTSRLPEDVARVEMDRLTSAGLDKVHFAYAGGTEPGQPHTYRLQGPTFVAEFLNVQADSARNPANHIHSAWRHLPKDFGLGAE